MKKVKLILLLICVLCFNFYIQRNQFIFKEQDGKDARTIGLSLSEVVVDSYTVPGVSDPSLIQEILKIGILSDMKHIFWNQTWNGAILAARELNKQGGILINDTHYYIGVVSEDTKEVRSGSPVDANTAAVKMVYHHEPHAIIGGITETTLSYVDVVMNDKILFIANAYSGDVLCQNVKDDYEKYKYIFRIMGNITSIFFEFVDNLEYLADYLSATYGGTVDKIAILNENEVWAEVTRNNLIPYLTYLTSLTVVKNFTYDETATSVDFENYWNEIEAAGAQIVIPLAAFSTNPVNYEMSVLMAQQYRAVKPHCLMFGFNLPSKQYSYWDDTSGACQYEVVPQGIYNISKTPLTIPFFTSFVNQTNGIDPFYPGTGAYDAVKLLAKAVNDSQSFNSDTIVSILEKINASNPWIGASGEVAFTSSHDLLMGYSHGHGLLCQWKYIDGTRVVLPTGNTTYPDSLATGSLRLPYWGINNLTDPPDPPGDFNLNTDAENFDYGIFNLTWTKSKGAENYSIYMSNIPNTYISKKFDLFDYQTATTPYPISIKQMGDYYFRVVAYNKTGETKSDSVHVNIPGPGSFNLGCDAGKPYDDDGRFNLDWDLSDRATNYSVYQYNKMITEINESLKLLVNQTTATSFPVTGLRDGIYYFRVAAFNDLGYTLSDIEMVVVQIPFDWRIILIISIGSVAGVASIVLVRGYMKRYGRIKVRKEDTHKPSSKEKGRIGLEQAKGKGKEDKHKK